MGNKISSDSITLKVFTKLIPIKPIKFKLDEINVQYHYTYVLFKPNKKINIKNTNNVRFLIEANYNNPKNKIFNSIQTLIDLDTDIHKSLTPNRIGDKNYLEKQLDNLLNDISITVRTNSKSQYLEQVLLKIPSDCYRRIP